MLRKKLANRIIVFLFSFVLIFSCIGSNIAMADTTGKDGGLTWTLNNNRILTIKGKGDWSGENPGWRADGCLNGASKVIVNVSDITNARLMFYSAMDLVDTDFKNFDTSNVKNMSDMFGFCYSLAKLDLSSLKTSNVKNMSSMFVRCYELASLNISGFDTSKVTNMSSMFAYCSSLKKLDMSNFNTVNVKNMSGMFAYCTHIKKFDLSGFDTSNVTNMSSMFEDCQNTSLDISGFDMSKVKDNSAMFFKCDELKKVYLPSSLKKIDKNAFEECTSLTDIYYCGDKKSWDAIKINKEGNDAIKQATIHYNCSPVAQKKVTVDSVRNTEDGVKIAWNDMVAADGFSIYKKNSDGKYELLKTVKGHDTLSFTDKNANKNGTTYSYKVRAYVNTKDGKSYSKYSNVRSIKYLTKPELSKVTSNKAKTVSVTWKKNSKATGYQVQVSTNSNFSGATSETVNKTSATISKLKSGKKYYVRVRAYKTTDDKTYYSAWSGNKSVVVK